MRHKPIIGWKSVKLASCILCAAVAAISAVDCFADEMAKTETKAIPQALETNHGVAGIRGMQVPCADDEWMAPDTRSHSQLIKIYVKPNTNASHEPKFIVTISPTCAELSHEGALQFKIDTTLVTNDWNPKNTVDLEFGLPLPQNPPPLVKGPFELDKLKQKKRGIYEDLGKNKEIPAKDFSNQVGKGWIDGYSVKIWGPNGEFLGEVDPGVKVIDDPGIRK